MLGDTITRITKKKIKKDEQCIRCSGKATHSISLTKKINDYISITYKYFVCRQHLETIAEPPSWEEIKEGISSVVLSTTKAVIKSQAAKVEILPGMPEDQVPCKIEINADTSIEWTWGSMYASIYKAVGKDINLCYSCMAEYSEPNTKFYRVAAGANRIYCDMCKQKVEDAFPMLKFKHKIHNKDAFTIIVDVALTAEDIERILSGDTLTGGIELNEEILQNNLDFCVARGKNND